MTTTKTRPAFIIELSSCGSVTTCRPSGRAISPQSALYRDLLDCTKPGDAEDACRYVLTTHKPEFRVVKQVNGEYQNVIADIIDKSRVCKIIYFESETDWSDESNCDLYLVWQAAFSLTDN